MSYEILIDYTKTIPTAWNNALAIFIIAMIFITFIGFYFGILLFAQIELKKGVESLG